MTYHSLYKVADRETFGRLIASLTGLGMPHSPVYSHNPIYTFCGDNCFVSPPSFSSMSVYVCE